MMIDRAANLIKVGVLGFGGLGQAAAKILAAKQEMKLVAAADHKGYIYDRAELNIDAAISTYRDRHSVGYLANYGVLSSNSIQDLLENAQVDGYFLALPNLPNTFVADIARQFIKSGWQGVLVDALKRTSAVEQLLELQSDLEQAELLI